jgi:hypothetical protein
MTLINSSTAREALVKSASALPFLLLLWYSMGIVGPGQIALTTFIISEPWVCFAFERAFRALRARREARRLPPARAVR